MINAKVTCSKPDDLSLISRTHMVERMNWLLEVFLWPLNVLSRVEDMAMGEFCAPQTNFEENNHLEIMVSQKVSSNLTFKNNCSPTTAFSNHVLSYKRAIFLSTSSHVPKVQIKMPIIFRDKCLHALSLRSLILFCPRKKPPLKTVAMVKVWEASSSSNS